ncbi:LytR/AlgR family response regulator transcription factor [Ekhidna sp.]
MKLLILEDEPLAIKGVIKIVEGNFNNIESIDQAQSIEQAKKLIDQGITHDLIISDIRLADGLSFELFREVDLNMPIIFTTAYDEYALDAFDHNGIAYVLKPINETKLVQAINKALNWGQEGREEGSVSPAIIRSLESAINRTSFKKRFLSKVGSRVVIKATNEISLFYTENKIVYMKDMNGKRFMISHSLDELEKSLLDPFQFYRINRSAIVNLDGLMEMKSYENGRLKLEIMSNTDDNLIVSRDRVPSFREWINQ